MQPLASIPNIPSVEAGWIEVKRGGRKRNVTRAAIPCLSPGSPRRPYTPSPAARPQNSGVKATSDSRKRRRTSREAVDDGGESSQPQPQARLQLSPGPAFARTVLPDPETHADSSEEHQAPTTGPALPSHLHPSAAWDAEQAAPQEENNSWNDPTYHTDLLWDHSVGHHIRRTSENGSFSASSVDEMIRNLASLPNPNSFFDPPAIVMARMTGNPTHVHASAGHSRYGEHPPPSARPAMPTPPPAIPAESSAFAAPWNNNSAPLHFEQHVTNSVHSSMRQTGPEIHVDITANIQSPSPRHPLAGYPGVHGLAGTSGRRDDPITSQQAGRTSEHAPSQASVLSYVQVQRDAQPQTTPIDVDAMTVDDSAIPEPAAQVPQDYCYDDPFSTVPPMHAPMHVPMHAPPLHAPPRPAPMPAPMPAPPMPAPPRPAPMPGPMPGQMPTPPRHAPPMPAPPMPAPPAANQRRAPVDHAIFNEQLMNEGPQVASGIDWLNADITRAPPENWQPIQFLSLKDVLKGQDKQQAKRWVEKAKQGKCLLIHIA
ncbi:uncharacterized protein C8Q71DRAFT_863574 [Rhodofomes roseus]|uniref:Uncharacterized protein n=1 Tax=Rhodofomes roseus TaxID=34475 RepID=A0ABQ8JXR9_9APHY|nr:uncharacterized protein C8Q71DRAFT_863574 [Rhodofomes roseus]KAH9829016.1 hypothetical protein C8Q71DRAFT_863574 [Rhodofomes roseus]